MRVTPTKLPGVLIIEPQVFSDERGFFFESFNAAAFHAATGLNPVFVQDNHSCSNKGVLRGLHYQLPPKAQAKLIRVVQGEVFDVAVDLRRASPTFGQWAAVRLSAENKKQLWLPAGLAHGFLTLSETAQCLYKTTDYWAPALGRCIRWDDATLNIAWPLDGQTPILAAKDAQGVTFAEADYFSEP